MAPKYRAGLSSCYLFVAGGVVLLILTEILSRNHKSKSDSIFRVYEKTNASNTLQQILNEDLKKTKNADIENINEGYLKRRNKVSSKKPE